MKLNTFLGVLLLWTLSLPGLAEDRPIDIKTDVKGKYFLVEKSSNGNFQILMVKRTTSKRSIYVKREFDCKARTIRILGSGENLEELAKDKADEKAHPIQKDSINEQLARLACSK